jgi:hypothetical protein
MKPVIAQRTTECYYCKLPIKPGEKRLTDVLPRSGRGQEKKFYITRHFHFKQENQDKSCLELWAEDIFETLPTRFRSNNPRGRPSLGLSEEATRKRNSLLKRIQNQIRYYIIQGNLDLTEPKYITEISSQDVKRAERFRDNLVSAIKLLEDVGGVPEKYKKYANDNSSVDQ